MYSHTNIRAVHAATPVADSENVMVFAPGLRLRDFYHELIVDFFQDMEKDVPM